MLLCILKCFKNNLAFSLYVFFQLLFVRKGEEPVAVTFVKFILELNPMETQCVQETLHHVH